MFRVNILRMQVKRDQAEEFEEQAKRQIAMVTENEPGTMLYVFCRRTDAASTILPKPPNDITEYIHLMAYRDEEAQKRHLDIEYRKEGWAWGPTFRQYMAGPWVAERFEAQDIVAGVSRDRQWNPTDMFRFAFHRFKIKEGTAEQFEQDVARQLTIVTEQEPGTILYTFQRRSAEGSALLPKSASGHPEYLHFMAYQDEAAQKRHLELEFREGGWAWGPVFKSYLEAPLENERFSAEAIVTGVSRNAVWTSSPNAP